MTFFMLILRSLAYYWRTHLGVLLGAALATGVLVGALAVGDSVRFSLREMALARLGDTQLAIASGDRYFTTDLAQHLKQSLDAPIAGVLDLDAAASIQGTGRRAPGIRVIGIDEQFWRLGHIGHIDLADQNIADDAVVINQRLADMLSAQVGDRVILRIQKPSALPRDLPLGSDTQDAVVLTATIAHILADDTIARFSLTANQIPPPNAFVPLHVLQKAANLPGRINTLLTGPDAAGRPIDLTSAQAALESNWTLADGELELRSLPDSGVIELRTRRVFLDQFVIDAAAQAKPGAMRLLTYFVNQFQSTSPSSSPPSSVRTTPYSMVTALSPPVDTAPSALNPLPADLAENDIVITDWLADDLAVTVGDDIKLSYFVLGTGRDLEQRQTAFHVRKIIPLDENQVDRDMMPDFPGLADVQSSRDWQPGIPIDFSAIRDKDETYWRDHRGTPKALVSLTWAQETWANRFGNLTAMRWHVPSGQLEQARAAIAQSLKSQLNPHAFGLRWQPVREQALAASRNGYDFSSLFIGFSFFLIIASILLTTLLFVFGVEQRSSELGMLLATGWQPARVRALLLAEGISLSIIATLLGVMLGVGYARAALWGLTSVWADAVSGATLSFHVTTQTLLVGTAISVLVAAAAMFIALRRQARQPARVLLASQFGLDTSPQTRNSRWSLWIAAALFGAALVLVFALGPDARQAAGIFFAAGSMVLIAGLLACRSLFHTWLSDQSDSHALSLASLGRHQNARRPGRALATITMLACGGFMVVAVNAFRHGAITSPTQPDSGTGGYTLYARMTLPIHEDLNTTEGRASLGLDDPIMQEVSFLPMRLREGDDASCLNLNRAMTPTLLGVDPHQLAKRNAFIFAKTLDQPSQNTGWEMLAAPVPEGQPIPAIADLNTAVWALGKSLGDTLTYTDDRGRSFDVQLVGLLATSILQGQIIIDRQQLMAKYPSISGNGVYLIDAPMDRLDAIQDELGIALSDNGIDVMPTAKRLASFLAVENTYLSIFQALGGLGVVLGAGALGIVVIRNLLERRHELAALRALGFTRPRLTHLVFNEYTLLLALGAIVGVIAAIIAIWPGIRAPGVRVPWLLMSATVGGILVAGIMSVWLATRTALQGELIDALRSE